MDNNNLKFYQIFKFGGFIGVSSLSLGEVLAANFLGFAFLIILIALLGTFLPFLLIGFYGLFLLFPNSEGNDLDKSRAAFVSILSYIYFLFDYSYGFLGTTVVLHFSSPEWLDNLCYIQSALFFINVILLCFGNKMFSDIPFGVLRLAIFSILIYYGVNKLSKPFSGIMPNIVTQYKPPVNKNKNN